MALVLPELEFPVGRGEQDRLFVFDPRVRPIAGFANLAVTILAFGRMTNLAQDLVEVDGFVGEDIFSKVG